MQISFEVVCMRPASGMLHTGSELLATFNVLVFPFKIYGGNVRLRPGGELFVTLPGRGAGSISISSPELIEAIRAEALAVFHERIGHGPRT